MATTSPKQQFLDAYDRETATTMKILRAFPADKADIKPHPKLKTAKDLAWVFVAERGLGTKVWHDELAKGVPQGKPPAIPEKWNDVLAALEKATKDFRGLVANATDVDLAEKVHFFTAPKTMGEFTRLDWAKFLLNDEIHHRGQFSVYFRMTDAKLPSIYGPTADEPWM